MVDGVSIDFMPHASQDHMIIQDQRLVSGQIELPFAGRRSNVPRRLHAQFNFMRAAGTPARNTETAREE